MKNVVNNWEFEGVVTAKNVATFGDRRKLWEVWCVCEESGKAKLTFMVKDTR